MFSNFVYDKRSRPGGFCKRAALKIFLKYIAKIPAIESCSVILLKKGLHWKCFSVNFANNFRSSYFIESPRVNIQKIRQRHFQNPVKQQS